MTDTITSMQHAIVYDGEDIADTTEVVEAFRQFTRVPAHVDIPIEPDFDRIGIVEYGVLVTIGDLPWDEDITVEALWDELAEIGGDQTLATVFEAIV